MARICIVPAVDAHIPPIAESMRRADRDEVWAVSRRTPHEAVANALAVSFVVWTGCIDDKPACMAGVATYAMQSGVGSPWLLATEHIAAHQRAFLRHSRAYIAKMLNVFPILENYVDERNHLSIRWLQWLGFTIGEPVPWGADRLPFRRFEMRRKNV